ncbi:MAG: FecR domain-containing protein [Calditrichaeota bacterium]|nr:FecR domain-containing protein [Calditrichota bacterium]
MKNKNILKLFTFLLLVSIPLFAADPVAVVIKAVGDISVKNTTSGKSVTAKRGTRLNDGDKIATGKNGRLAVKFLDDNSLLRIRPNSTLIIEAKKEQNSVAKNVIVEVGQIFSRITKQKSSFRVTTPTSVASVKGTEFWTVQEFKGATTYFGDEGTVEISNDAGSALMHEGETGYVTSKNSKPIVRKTKPGEKPTFEEGDAPDEFEFEFENESGNKKLLKFKAKSQK